MTFEPTVKGGYSADKPLHRRNWRHLAAYLNGPFIAPQNLQPGSVGPDAILDGAITDGKIANVSASKITAGTLGALIEIGGGSLFTGGPGERRIELDANGLRWIDDDDEILEEWSTDPLFEPPVDDTVSGTVPINESIDLASSVSVPAAPSIQTFDGDAFDFALDASNVERFAAYYDATLDRYIYTSEAWNSAGSAYLIRVDPNDTDVIESEEAIPSSGNLGRLSHGCVYIPAAGVWVNLFSDTADELYWQVIDEDGGSFGSVLSTTKDTSFTPSDPDSYSPKITTDGTDVWMAVARSSDKKVRFRRYTVSGSTVTFDSETISDTALNGLSSTYYHVMSYYRGSGDLGGTRNIISELGRTDWMIFNSSGVRQTSEEFAIIDPPANQTESHGGLMFDGFFLEVTSEATQQMIEIADSDIPAGTYWFATTYYDSDASGGTHETALSPRTQVTVGVRTIITVSWAAPLDGGGADDPDTARVYMKANATDPGSLFASYFRQGGAHSGTSLGLDDYDTGTAGSQDTAFTASGSPGQIASGVGSAVIRGDGVWMVPQFAADPSAVGDGQIYYNTATDKFRGRANGTWVDLH